MKRVLFLSTLFAISQLDLNAQQKKNILFIGNSYTQNHNIPSLINAIANSVGDTLTYEAHTPGGSRFSEHAINTNVDALINAGGWDGVVLQEQSQLPAFRQGDVRNMVFPYATQLANKVRAVDSCTEVIFYNTWGRRDGDNQNCAYYSVTCTYEGMDDELFMNYEAMARDNEATLSPVGKVWRYLRTNYPNLELYENDGSHQNQVGAYAIAMTFNTIIFGTKPITVSYTGNLSAADADAVKEAVSSVVYDNINTWRQYQYIKFPSADYAFSNQNNTYTFTAIDSFNNTFKWYVNDSLLQHTDATLEYTFTTEGTYNVCLEATNACKSVKNCINVEVKNMGIHNINTLNLNIYPNPATHIINIGNQINVSHAIILDVYGKEVLQTTSNQIDVSQLNTGMYILKIVDKNGYTGVKQFIKQ